MSTARTFLQNCAGFNLPGRNLDCFLVISVLKSLCTATVGSLLLCDLHQRPAEYPCRVNLHLPCFSLERQWQQCWPVTVLAWLCSFLNSLPNKSGRALCVVRTNIICIWIEPCRASQKHQLAFQGLSFALERGCGHSKPIFVLGPIRQVHF
jgi:hypothetical protein